MKSSFETADAYLYENDINEGDSVIISDGSIVKVYTKRNMIYGENFIYHVPFLLWVVILLNLRSMRNDLCQ